MKRISTSLASRRRKVPARKKVAGRDAAVGKYRNPLAVPERKENLTDSNTWFASGFGSRTMERRQWTVMMARICHSRDLLSKCVTVDPLVMSGVPVVVGTRVPVAMVLANLAAGMSLPEIAEDLELDKQTLVSILRCLATAFDRPAHEYYPVRRMHELKATGEFLCSGGPDLRAPVPKNLIWEVD